MAMLEKGFKTVGKMDTFVQLDVARKLAATFPILSMVVENSENKSMGLLMIQALGSIPDEDSNFIIGKALSLVVRITQEGSFPIYTKGAITYSDITLQDVLDITAEVIVENLGDFLHTALGL